MKYKAFTLVELLVVVTIIGILSGVTIVRLSSVQKRSQDTSRFASLRDLEISLEAYKSVTGSYPPTLTSLVPVYINRLPVMKGESSTAFNYDISSDQKTYCLYLIGKVFNPSAQPDLDVDCPMSWGTCKGRDPNSMPTCSTHSSSDSSESDTNLDTY